MKFAKSLLRILSIVYLCAMCFLGISPYWPSALHWLANFFQLLPLWLFILPAGVLFMAALLLRSKGVVFVNLASFVIAVFFIMGFKVSFAGLKPENVKAENRLRVVSCNLGNSFDEKALTELVSETRPDIIAFQEAYPKHQEILEKILKDDGWDMLFHGYLGIASRLKIKNAEAVNRDIVHGWGNLVVRYDLEHNSGVIRLFNVHMDTPRPGIEAVMGEKLGGISEIIRVSEIKDKESEILSRWITRHEAVLVAGDFNMLDTNPVYRKYWSRFINAFSKAGFGFGYTKFTRWHGARIDHLLSDRNWKVTYSGTGRDIGSDHRPVLADFEFAGSYPDYARAGEAASQSGLSGNGIAGGGFKNYLSIKSDYWSLEEYPVVNFVYMIPEGAPLEIRAKTIFNDWLYLTGTETEQLVNDGLWREASINVRALVKNILPGVKYIQELQFVSPQGAKAQSPFWIDEVRITKEE